MTDFIKVPYAELMQRATRIRQEADAVRSEIKSLKETINNISWIGKRADRFFTNWEETVTDLEAWVQVLENFAIELEEQGRRMQMIDEAT